MLNLAGVDLILENPDHEVREFIETYISTHSYLMWLRPTRPGPNSASITFPWPRKEPYFRINRLVWPQSATRWAVGHFLASSDQVAAIMANAYTDGGCYNEVTLMIGTPDIGPQVGMPGGMDNQISAQVFLMPPTPLSGIRGLTGPCQSLYLLSVCDQRFFWFEASTGDLQIGTMTSWDDVYSMIATQLGLSSSQFTWDAIETEYLSPSSMFNLSYQPCPFALDAVAMNVGQRIVVNYDGTVMAKNPTNEFARLNGDFDANPATRLVVAGSSRFSQPL